MHFRYELLLKGFEPARGPRADDTADALDRDGHEHGIFLQVNHSQLLHRGLRELDAFGTHSYCVAALAVYEPDVRGSQRIDNDVVRRFCLICV